MKQKTLSSFFGGKAGKSQENATKIKIKSNKDKSEEQNDSAMGSNSDTDSTSLDNADDMDKAKETRGLSKSSKKHRIEDSDDNESDSSSVDEAPSSPPSSGGNNDMDASSSSSSSSAAAAASSVEADLKDSEPSLFPTPLKETKPKKKADAKDPDEKKAKKSKAQKASKSEKVSKAPPKKRAKTDADSSDELTDLDNDDMSGVDLNIIETKNGKQVPFLSLCEVFACVEATTKRLEITKEVKRFLLSVMKVGQDQFTIAVMLCINKVAPDHEGIELGIGESILQKSIAHTTGRPLAKVRADQRTLGDLGKVAQHGRSSQRTMFKPKPLTLTKVFDTFREIASTSGSSAVNRKQSLISGLLVSCSDLEAKYLIRALEGKLRIGLAESTVLTSLAQAALIYERASDDEKKKKRLETSEIQETTEKLKAVFSEYPVYADVIKIIYEHGVSKVREFCGLTAGVPVKPMLAKIENSAADILERFDGMPFTCEYKYDGERNQIHYIVDGTDENPKCTIFSRNAENNTIKYPDIASSVKEFANDNVTSFILDCEAVAWDSAKGNILTFQTLSSRKKKVENEDEITVRVCCFAFDLLYLNGESLIYKPLRVRRELLRKNFTVVENKFQFAKSKDLDEVEGIQEFLEDSIKDNCEGLMVKVLDGDESTYEPSKRSQNWVKLKKDYVEGLGDSLDLVVIGAYYGKGKRVGSFGAYLLACYDNERDEYQTICKIGTGFSDADLESHKTQLEQSIIDMPKRYYAYSDKTKPDVWFEPNQVWEVKAADLSLSPIYQAAYGQIDGNKGVSLRFPRFIRVREDKNADMATSSTQVAEMYESQQINTA